MCVFVKKNVGTEFRKNKARGAIMDVLWARVRDYNWPTREAAWAIAKGDDVDAETFHDCNQSETAIDHQIECLRSPKKIR